MLTENDVVDAVSEYLKQRGFQIIQTCSTKQRGVDIVAEYPATKEKLLVEAKGGTSSKAGTANFGKPFTLNQVKTHVSVAFYHAAMLLQKHSNEPVRIALAFPDDELHHRRVKSIASVLGALGIIVFFVDSMRQVTGNLDANQNYSSPNVPEPL